MAFIILSIFFSLMVPSTKESAPKRIGTRTKADFLNCGAVSFVIITLETNNRIALEPISIAAYFFIEIKRFYL